MNELSENTQFKINLLEEQMTENEVNIETFLDAIHSVFEDRENVLKSADEVVIDNFKEIMRIGGKAKATAATVVSRFSAGTKPFTREYAIMFCYAAGYNSEEADNQLRKIFRFDGFHLRNYEDLIDYFFLRANTIETCIENFAAAQKMKAEFKPMYEEAEVDAPIESSAAENLGEYTEFFEKQSENIGSAEQLENFLKSPEALQRAGSINRTSKAYLYDVLIVICEKIIEKIDLAQSNNDLEQLYAEADGKKLSESFVRLLRDIFDPYTYYKLEKINICTRPQYYEKYSGSNNYSSLTKELRKQKQAYDELRTSAEVMIKIWNSNYNDISISFNNAVRNGRFSNLFDCSTVNNKSSYEEKLKLLESLYFHSMFNLLVYDGLWGLADYLGLPRTRTKCSMTVNEEAVEGNSTLRGINQIDELYFFYSPELSEFVINYMTDIGVKFKRKVKDKEKEVTVKPFAIGAKSVRDLMFISVSMLIEDSDDNIDDYIDGVIRESGKMPSDNSDFSHNLSKLVNELDNTKSTEANAMLISGDAAVNRTLLVFCLVLRELSDSSSKDPKTMLNNVNQSLIHSKMAQLNPHNTLDLLLLGSIYTNSPLSYIKAYMLYMMPNI